MAKAESPPQSILALDPRLRHSPGKRLIDRFSHNVVAIIGLLIVTVMVIMAVFGPLVAPHDPDEQFRGHRLDSPGQVFLLGTDNLGRDILSRLLHGARVYLSSTLLT